MIKNCIQIMCKHKELDADFSPKTMECFYNILDEDEDAIVEDNECEVYGKLVDKENALFSGEQVDYGDYICYMQDVKTKTLIKDLKKEILLTRAEFHIKMANLEHETEVCNQHIDKAYEALKELKGDLK